MYDYTLSTSLITCVSHGRTVSKLWEKTFSALILKHDMNALCHSRSLKARGSSSYVEI